MRGIEQAGEWGDWTLPVRSLGNHGTKYLANESLRAYHIAAGIPGPRFPLLDGFSCWLQNHKHPLGALAPRLGPYAPNTILTGKGRALNRRGQAVPFKGGWTLSRSMLRPWTSTRLFLLGSQRISLACPGKRRFAVVMRVGFLSASVPGATLSQQSVSSICLPDSSAS